MEAVRKCIVYLSDIRPLDLIWDYDWIKILDQGIRIFKPGTRKYLLGMNFDAFCEVTL